MHCVVLLLLQFAAWLHMRHQMPHHVTYVRLNKLRDSESIPDKSRVVHTAVLGHVSGQTGGLTVSLLQDLRSPRLMIASRGLNSLEPIMLNSL